MLRTISALGAVLIVLAGPVLAQQSTSSKTKNSSVQACVDKCLAGISAARGRTGTGNQQAICESRCKK